MQIHVLLFGILKTVVGQSSDTLDLPQGARVADLLGHYKDRFPQFESLMRSLAVSVNHEYSRPDRTLAAGDEVGLLPPVSGGATPEAASAPGLIAIVKEPIETLAVLNRLKRPQDGAAVVFEGIVRDHTRNRRTLHLEYEAYEPMAIKQLHVLAEQARARFAVRGVSIIHRLGRLQIGETSVLIVVASEHRAAAFEACRWLIDTLKKTVPIWKKEYFEDGAVWADGEPFPEEIQRPGGTTGRDPASK
jgi:molybdopterin synthase catalytic subunit